ncbi:MAG TPA: LysE family transporter, partial [Methanomassiliicoccales archaeon]|nr:LysE family transporter [Methanomassiliicoccales archaeon]
MLSDLPLVFLASVAIISLSGVMMPGPVFAATVAQGYHDRNAGLKLTLGHAVVELPLLALIFLGFATIFSQPEVVAAIGLIGGAILIWMGYDMIKARETMIRSEGRIHRTAFQ